MRTGVRLAGAALALLLATSGVARAASITANPLITLDEYGNGSLLFNNGLPAVPTTGVLAADPGPGGLPSALTYNLLGPPSLVAGDLIILESADVISDIIRFNPAGTGSAGYPASVVFYSDNLDGVDAIADVGLPSGRYTNVVRMFEVGPEGANGVVYTPTEGQPGFVAGFQVTYDIRSDSAPVPEPGTLVLATSGLLAAYRARRRRTTIA